MDAIEKRLLADVRTDDAWALVEAYSTMPRWKPEDVNRGVDHLVGVLQRLGVSVTVHEPEIYLSIPYEASVSAGGRAFRAKPPSMSPSVPDGIEGELVYVEADPKNFRSYSPNPRDLFGDAATAAARVKGKIALTDGFANPANCAILAGWGAIAVIAVNPGIDIHWGTCTTVWGSPDLDDLPRKPAIPAVAVNHPDGDALKAIAAAGGRATVRTRLEEGWWKQKIPVVEIPGAVEKEKFVLLHGHLDSWDVGVGDNATGDATMLEVARVLWQNRAKLRRSVRIAWWPGHSTGRYAGSTWFADAFAIDLDENCVAQIDCDSPGCRWATSYHQTTTMSETADFVLKAIRDVTGIEGKTKRPNHAGDYSFNDIGISSYFMLSSTMPDDLRREKNYYAVSGCGGNIAWHTENDTLEIADRDVLATDIKIYLLCTWRNATAPVLPYDFRAVQREFAGTIANYQKAAGIGFDLAPAHAANDAFGTALESFYSGIVKGKVTEAAANEVQLRLGRILVPINFSTVPRFRHHPAHNIPQLPTLATATELAYTPPERLGFAKTQLLRGRNRFVAAVREATRLVERATR
jgi:N-acetylated-alpha-linked acidic dipeptidase